MSDLRLFLAEMGEWPLGLLRAPLGKVEVVADRRAGALQVHAVHPDVHLTRAVRAAIDTELSALAGWLELELELDPLPRTLTKGPGVTDLKPELHRTLRVARADLLSKLDGLSEYDRRRPLTTTGTNLLGLVKHLAGIEHLYLGTAFDRPPATPLPWVADGSIWAGADMWATVDESSTDLIALYQAACAHADVTIDQLALDTSGTVAHWPPDRRTTTLGVLLVRVVTETARHAGHADIVRELIDRTAGPDQGALTAAEWRAYVGGVQAAADHFR